MLDGDRNLTFYFAWLFIRNITIEQISLSPKRVGYAFVASNVKAQTTTNVGRGGSRAERDARTAMMLFTIM